MREPRQSNKEGQKKGLEVCMDNRVGHGIDRKVDGGIGEKGRHGETEREKWDGPGV